MNKTKDVLKKMVPKCAKLVNGRYQGGFSDWDSEEGKAVNEALHALALFEELKELDFCHNYQNERSDLVEWIDSINQIIKDAKNISASDK